MSEQQTTEQPPLDYQKWAHELQRQDAQRAHDKTDDFFDLANEAAVKAAESALRMAMLINGGAAVSVLAFIGGLVSQGRVKIDQLSGIADSLALFAIGTALSVGAMAASYFTHYFMGGIAASQIRMWEHPYLKDAPKTKTMRRCNFGFHMLAIVLGLASLGMFVYAMFNVREAITYLAHNGS